MGVVALRERQKMNDPMCKCKTQMEAQSEKVGHTYRYYWLCPKCGLKREFGKRIPKEKTERDLHK